jgi:hypothetical protein
MFSSSSTSDSEAESDRVIVKRTKSAATKQPVDTATPKRKRRTKAEMEEARALKAMGVAEKPAKKSAPVTPLVEMYVLKFNSPILPFAKFPLTHNKYI